VSVSTGADGTKVLRTPLSDADVLSLKAGDRVRINAQLIDAESNRHVWAQRYDRKMDDLFELQDDIVASIASVVGPEITLAEIERTWGPGEGQPGPRVTYRCADHPGQFLWVYYFLARASDSSRPDKVLIHHIVRADRLEEGPVVAWPDRWVGEPVGVASADLRRLYGCQVP